MWWCSMPTRPVTKDARMQEQLPLFQEGKTHRKSLPIYRVTLVREGQLPSYEQRIRSSRDASRLLATYLAGVDREHFVVLLLDQKNQVIGFHTVSMGSLTASIVHPREVFKAAILANAAAMICGHNHPSGDVQPSREDRAITLRLVDAGKLLGISVVDHIIIGGDGRYFSFADEGLLDAA
jgi:DNA repair protein RadC